MVKQKYFLKTIKGFFSVEINQDNKIQKLDFPDKSASFILPRKLHIPKIIKNLSIDLDRCFSGEYVDFLKYDIHMQGTCFQKLVWQNIRTIPYGSTVSYGELSKKIRSNGYRAVGSACGKNPVPILIPCHRVIAKNNKIGGFSSGLNWKLFLLECEHNKNFLNN